VTQTQVIRSDAEEMGMNNVFTTTDIKTQGSSGPEETITVTARYPDGYPSVVSVERRKLKASTEHRWLDSIRAPSSRKVRPTRHNSRSPASLEVTAAFAWIESS
jgi:hypothetical protein